jgi:uncharacterized protein (TIRG00374 family)
VEPPLRFNGKRRKLRYFLSVCLVGVAVLIFFSRFEGWRDVPLLFQEAHKKPLWLLLFLEALYFFLYGVLSKVLLDISFAANHEKGNRVSLKETVKVGVLGVLGFQVAPFVGSSILLYLFYKKLKVPSSAILFLVAVLTIFNWLSGFALGILSFVLLPESFCFFPEKAVLACLSVTLLFLVAGYFLVRQGAKNLVSILRRLAFLVNKVSRKLLRKEVLSQEKMARIVEELLKDLNLLLKEPAKSLKALALSLLFYLLNVLIFYLSFYVFGYQANFPLLVLGLIASSFVSLLSLFPEAPGVMEASLVAVFVALGFPAHVTLLASLLYRLVSYWLPLPLGFYIYLKLNKEEKG